MNTLVDTTDPDPTPLVLSIVRTLRASSEHPSLRELIQQTTGSIALVSTVDAQAATLTFADGRVGITRGAVDGVQPIELAFDPEYTLGQSTSPVAAAVAKLLQPPIPPWREAAEAFWALNAGTRGFPDCLVIACTDEDAELRLGDGDSVFEIHGAAPALAAVLSGRGDSFLFALAGGDLSVVGTVAQVSVMCGAHWKVRFGE